MEVVDKVDGFVVLGFFIEVSEFLCIINKILEFIVLFMLIIKVEVVM